MTKSSRVILYSVITVVLAGLAYAAYYVYTNTSFLRFHLAQEDLQANNFNVTNNSNQATNLPSAEQLDLLTLIPQTLQVPEKFRSGVLAKDRLLNVPAGFIISVFAAGLSEPRFFTFDADNNLIVADKDSGKIVLIKDTNSDGASDETITVDQGLQVMHSVFFYEGDLYAAEEHQVSVYRDVQTDGTYSKKEILVSGLPSGAGHSTRTVIIGPDKKMYVSVGSSCNVCEESDSRRAAVMRYNLDGSGAEVFASGLRNSVGITFYQDELWSVDMGRDQIGDDIPPEEVNVVKQGQHYGWPYCYGQGVVNPEYEGARESFCKNETAAPVYEMQAHSAPLGLTFMPEERGSSFNFPSQLEQNLFIGFHGSWNRSVPTGYKVVTIDTTAPSSQAVNFVTGWLETNGQAWGRPVDVGFDHNGILYISDDKAGIIYRVEYHD